MKIKYFGHSCFVLETNDGTKIMTDPYTRVGYKLPPRLEVDVVTLSHNHFDHNHTQAVLYNRIVDGVGEQATGIYGIESYHDAKHGKLRGENRVYKIVADGITFCHLGDLGEECSPSILEKIGKVDVLFIPVGGTYTIDAAQAKAYVDKIAPKAVIPMHYKPKDGTLDIDGIEPFLSFFAEDEIEKVTSGETEFDLKTRRKRVIYMERIKYDK